jgi:hypothetical protein
MAAINDIGWWARVKDGRRGFRVTCPAARRS